jgi:hypothetical protein
MTLQQRTATIFLETSYPTSQQAEAGPSKAAQLGFGVVVTGRGAKLMHFPSANLSPVSPALPAHDSHVSGPMGSLYFSPKWRRSRRHPNRTANSLKGRREGASEEVSCCHTVRKTDSPD